MDVSLKVVTRLPLQELWQDNGFTTTARSRSLTREDINSLLRIGPVQFVVADVGTPLRWIELGDCYEFWKAEAKPHLATVGSSATLKDFPEMYCYFASLWDSGDTVGPIVALEKHH